MLDKLNLNSSMLLEPITCASKLIVPDLQLLIEKRFQKDIIAA